jgi:hypothetical protein
MWSMIFRFGFEKAEQHMNNFYKLRKKLGKLKQIDRFYYD